MIQSGIVTESFRCLVHYIIVKFNKVLLVSSYLGFGRNAQYLQNSSIVENSQISFIEFL